MRTQNQSPSIPVVIAIIVFAHLIVQFITPGRLTHFKGCFLESCEEGPLKGAPVDPRQSYAPLAQTKNRI